MHPRSPRPCGMQELFLLCSLICIVVLAMCPKRASAETGDDWVRRGLQTVRTDLQLIGVGGAEFMESDIAAAEGSTSVAYAASSTSLEDDASSVDLWIENYLRPEDRT